MTSASQLTHSRAPRRPTHRQRIERGLHKVALQHGTARPLFGTAWPLLGTHMH